MNKSKLIWGIICLIIAGGLSFLILAVPSANVTFMWGNINMPWVPTVGLAILGIVLLSTANQSEEKEEAKAEVDVDPNKAAMNKNLERVAWGAFLIMLGGFLFVPNEIIRGGWWSIGVGLIFLGLNAARYFNGLRMSGFTTFLGILSVIGGILGSSTLVEPNSSSCESTMWCIIASVPHSSECSASAACSSPAGACSWES